MYMVTVFVKKSHLSGWVFTASMQTVHIQMNSS